LIVDDMDVRLFITNQTDPFFGNLSLSAELSKAPVSDGFGESLFRSLLLLPQTTIGTRCSPVPDFAIRDGAARRLKDHRGEVPYIGEWRNPVSLGLPFEGQGARGAWHLTINGFLVNTVFGPSRSRYTLECWCLTVMGPREGLRLEPSRATLPVFEGISDSDESDLGEGGIIVEGGHTVEATVNSSTGPVADVPVTFTVRDRGGQGDVLATAVEMTNSRGRAYYHYLDWVPGEQTIEARAEVNGAIYTDIARVTWINPCAATAALQGTPGAESRLQAMRGLRDSRLARSRRGREYSRLYYKFSSEAISLMMLNPWMVLRSQGMIERYMPVIRDLAAGKDAVLTEGDLDEIDSFMNEFAASGSAELQQTIRELRRDLRDPRVHSELGISVRPGARRELPSRGQLQGLRQMGEMSALLGFLLCGVLLIRWRRRKRLRTLLCVVISISSIATDSLPFEVTSVQGQGETGGPEFSTYLGGTGSDQATAVATDAEGNLYVAGITDSADLQTTGAAQSGFGGGAQDGFVAKLDPTGRQLIYLTYLGGSGNDAITGLAVDSGGNAYVTGFTTSTDFPVLNALQPNNRGRFNGFVTKLGSAGSLVYSTYLGGSASDAGSGIAVDSLGNAYVAGIATSANFPTVNAVQSSQSGASDLFVAKLNAAGNQLIYSTYLGGSREDAATAIAVDPTGSAHVTGATLSPDFRTANALQGEHGGGIFDAFVVKLNPSGNQVVYSTYLGGEGSDRGMRIATDSTGAAYVTGDTRSTDFPLRQAAQPSPGGSSDAFVTKLAANGGLVYSTYLGGSGIDGGTAISVDTSDAAHVTGYSGSEDFPAVGALQEAFRGGEYDTFVVKLNPSGMGLELSTWLGGSGLDTGYGIAAGAAGRIYVVGLTGSIDFPTANPLQPGNSGGASDVFVAQVRRGPTITAAVIQGKHLDITGSGFERGAVILLDGEPQKTKFKNSTSLRGKKVGKKIAPGETVEVQVRNPDGVESGVFSFRR
ncbi:MAG TPA: SBBP repeat-containing protein, partial [Blastocatellia bacterium]|nr:SBBP repeat-containing protein [Blastocatellia bacterium]